jgi:hypothetical protein
MNTHCHFCQESVPFYKQVVQARQGRQAGVAFSVLSSELVDDVKAFLSKEGIAVDGVYRVGSAAGLHGTPMLLMVDGTGTVRRVFPGALDADRREQVLKSVRNGTI